MPDEAAASRAPARHAGAHLATAAALLLVWQATAQLVRADFLPGPLEVLPRLLGLLGDPSLWVALGASLRRLALAFLLAATGGIALGLAIGRAPAARALIEPLLALSYPVPKAAVLPIVMLWFGAGDIAQIFVIATTATLPVIYHTADGARRVDDRLLWAAASMGCGRLRRLRLVVLPATLPEIAAGCRTGIVMALIVMVTAEMISRQDGIGSQLFVYFDMGQSVNMYALIVLLGVVGLGLDAAFEALRRRLTGWSDQR